MITRKKPHHNEVTDLTNIPTSPEVDDSLNPGNEIRTRYGEIILEREI